VTWRGGALEGVADERVGGGDGGGVAALEGRVEEGGVVRQLVVSVQAGHAVAGAAGHRGQLGVRGVAQPLNQRPALHRRPGVREVQPRRVRPLTNNIESHRAEGLIS